MTVESLIAECDEARRIAIEDRNPQAMIAATREKGVLSGKRIERSERGEPGEFDWIERASDQQLVDFIESGIVPSDVRKLN